VFLDQGQHVGTNLVFTDPAHDGVELYADGGALTVHALEIHDLEAIWTT
jgi:sucrose-6-phosphate hydrolase SacC (GH32 family)